MAGRAVDEADIRRRIDGLVEAIRAADLEGVKAIYAPDIVSFDVSPPLQHKGAEAQFAHSLNRISGTLRKGKRTGWWVRWTPCFRKIDGRWLIVHHQASVPFDPETGRAALDLEP